MINGLGVGEDDEVEPAAAAAAAGGDAVFVAEALEGVAGVLGRFRLVFMSLLLGGAVRGGWIYVCVFAWEGAAADAGCVGFDDADDFFDFEGGEGETVDCSAGSCSG